jgi:DNA-binding GntR family transcriptional regulator
MTRSGSTRVDEVYARIRRDILSGQYPPGGRLGTVALQQRYKVSNGLLREILPRLVAEGLAVAKPQRGFWVIEVSREDLRHLTEARVIIETIALRQSIQDGDLAWESAVLAAHHTLASLASRLPDGSLNSEWLEAHAQFHGALLAGGPNLRLRSLAESLRDVTEVYRCWSRGLGQPAERDIAAEHRAIMEATLARDANLAVAELTLHVEKTTRQLLSQLDRAKPAGQVSG